MSTGDWTFRVGARSVIAVCMGWQAVLAWLGRGSWAQFTRRRQHGWAIALAVVSVFHIVEVLTVLL